ncbi:hypothetical protein KP509_36G051700 [Ceratopteris richardii]|uniref:Uncharacterized protein n=1 Tax=Ceratopteris richardii TaxID=49495 RepID=A0A8T2QD19_CERRI|nr:hypothetical protein KP509_36G051700 [Ceratopteris richardii]
MLKSSLFQRLVFMSALSLSLSNRHSTCLQEVNINKEEYMERLQKISSTYQVLIFIDHTSREGGCFLGCNWPLIFWDSTSLDLNPFVFSLYLSPTQIKRG